MQRRQSSSADEHLTLHRRLRLDSLEAGLQLLLKQLRNEKTAPLEWEKWLSTDEAVRLHGRLALLDEELDNLCNERAQFVGEARMRAEAIRDRKKTGVIARQSEAAELKAREIADGLGLPKWLPGPV